MERERTDVLGVGFDDLTPEEAQQAAEGISGGYVVTPNPEIVWLARKDSDLARALQGASLVLADGVGITLGAKLLGRPLQARVPGIDFATERIRCLAEQGGSVFLFGAKPGVADRAAEALLGTYPGLQIAGTANGYFTDDSAIVDAINAAAPDFLLVCLGAPKQELWMEKNIGRLQVKLMAGLGGVLDVYAGVAQRAPEAWRKLGLEWLYRILKQPSRIKRAGKLPLFVFAVLGQRIRGA